MKLTENKPHVISIRITDEHAKILDEVASTMGVKRNELVRIIVHSACTGWKKQEAILNKATDEVRKEMNENDNNY